MNKLILSLMVLGLGISVNCYGFHSEDLNPNNEIPLQTLNNQVVVHKKSEWTDKSKHMVNYKETSPSEYLKLRLQFAHPRLNKALNIIQSVSRLTIVGTGVGMIFYHNNAGFHDKVQNFGKLLLRINSGYIKPCSGKAFNCVKLYPKTCATAFGVLFLYYKSQKFRNAVQKVFGTCFNPALNRIKSFNERSFNKVREYSASALNRVMDFSNKSFNYVYDKVHECFSVTFNSVKFLF